MKHTLHLCAAAFLLITPWTQAGELKLASLFCDHMVLQREQAVPVWGRAKAGEEIAVEFAGQRKSVTADADGQWQIKLDPMSASLEGRGLTVTSSDHQTLRLSDVVVGDVWLASGQSNMHFPMKRVANAAIEIAAADHPAIRFFYAKPQFAQQPAGEVTGAWVPVSPATAEECSAVAYYFARDLQPALGVPLGLLLSSVGGTRIESWMNPATLAGLGMAGSLVEKWRQVPAEKFRAIVDEYAAYQHQLYKVHPGLVRTARSEGSPPPSPPRRPEMRPHDCPGALHQGMIAPLRPFALRGALWYQGEGNVGNPGGYEKMLPAMIAEWREAWGAGLPFLIVQLPPHETITPQFREAQFRIWEGTPQTAMVVTTDVGDAKELHPPRKRPIGERLARAARAEAYGEPVEYSGPVFEKMEIEGNRAVISFTHLGDGLKAGAGRLKGFVVAGSDGKFFPARAVIAGSTVVVSAEEVERPTIVHFGHSKVPDLNLFSQAGLPAVPFRSDMPARVTKGSKTPPR